MELHQIRSFVAIAEHGSLTAAARAVHATQPTLSGHLKALEAELGLTLFRRGPRGMVLTPEGESLLPHARAALQSERSLQDAAARLRHEPAPTLRLSVNRSGFDHRTGEVILRLRAAFPGTRIDLDEQSSGRIAQDLLAYRTDLGTVEGPVDDERIELLRLGSTRLGIIAPADWRTSLDTPDWSVLQTRPWIFQSTGCSYYRAMRQLAEERGLELQPLFKAEQIGTVINLVTAGVGLSIADLGEVEPFTRAGQLFAWPHWQSELDVSVAVLRERLHEPTLHRARDLLAAVHQPARRKAHPASAAG